MEYLLVDKIGDYHYFKNLKDIGLYLDLTVSQINNEFRQSLKHYNKYTNREVYIQRLFMNPVLPPRLNFDLNKYIYYVNEDGTTKYGEKFKLK
tara:strand:- start:7793 stop:8071 length:279 start_codon:yes stop_codon:yes gene_type:complete